LQSASQLASLLDSRLDMPFARLFPFGVIKQQGSGASFSEISSHFFSQQRTDQVIERAGGFRGVGLSAIADGCAGHSAGLLPPSPPAEKADARQDQTGQSCTDDGTGDSNSRSSYGHGDWREAKADAGKVGGCHAGE
jgi:hypothetical protein